MPLTVDLNCDMGESFGSFVVGSDAGVVPHITSANLGCGFHGGDPATMRRSVELCRSHGVAVGAHPGLPDLVGFGRRRMTVTPAQVRDDVLYQVGAMQAFTRAAGVRMQHVKPHGALYMMALEDDAISDAIIEAVAVLDDKLMIFTTGGTATQRAANRRGLRVVREFFADRPLTAEGWRMFGSKTSDIAPDAAGLAARARRAVVERKAMLTDGSDADVRVDTICVHSDTPDSPAIVRAIRESLTAAGVRVVRPSAT
jgi:UPF0271 protein